ncbi:MAG TPA: HAMP domain-containing sensor histidine kinase [Kofleriaceae bacterium]
MRSRRAWIYVLSVLALLVPAGGIAYLGAFSYRDDKGAVSAQTARQKKTADAIAGRITRAIEDTFDAIESAVSSKQVPRGPLAPPLSRYWFWIEAHGRIVVPRSSPPRELASSFDRAPCDGRLEDCVRDATTRQVRLAKLQAAQRAEACRGDACAAQWQEARRIYASLAGFDDTGPTALLGLARVYQRLGDARGTQGALSDLELRYGDRTVDELPAKLVVAILRAEKDRGALLEIAEAVAAGKYDVHPVVGVGVIGRLRAKLDGAMAPDLASRRSALDEQMSAIKNEARAAAGLADDVPDLLHDASPAWRGKPAEKQPARMLIYKKRPDGSVIGMAVDAQMLEQAAGHAPSDNVAVNAQPLVLPVGNKPDPKSMRQLADASFGEKLPHLTLHLVNQKTDPDPVDEVIRARYNRHLAYTSALAIMLGLGILATIRGAARARELAQLKSDFVSTVSHELKTPLTSIRMFAEMLEQGVAQGDEGKMARYHGVIVQESQRLGLLIANLLDYSQIERGTRRYTPSRENLEKLARHAVTTFETLRDPEKGRRNPIELTVSSEAMKSEVEVDRDVVVQAVLNLLANAAKYGAADRPIEVDVRADEFSASIAVTDHGPGIPAHEQARIFREFYRAPEAYRSGIEGTGLGLALVKRHIEALGGSVDVQSTVGHGATFTIRLPRVEAVA